MSQKIKPLIYPYHWDIIGNDSRPRARAEYDPRFLEYRREWEENPVNYKVSDFPLQLDIEVSGRCNLMCSHCVRHSRRTDIGDIDVELFKKIIDEGSRYGLYAMSPHWLGESFLHPHLIEMIKYAKYKGVVDIRINTNCTLIDEEMANKVLGSGLDTLICSIDAVEEETYNRIKLGSDFSLVNENIERLISLRDRKGLDKPKIIVQMIDMKKTHEELASFVDYWRVRADKVRVATYQSPDGRPNDRNRVRNAPDSIFPCPQLWQRLVIAWDGTVYSCLGNNACRDPLGNVKEMPLYDIWHGDKLNKLRQLHIEYKADDIEMCAHCDLNKIPHTAKKYNGDKRCSKKRT
ncbi:MAG: radical SAM protein [Candidatus Omnitrophota bacterium]